jgi:hypothetical protein
MLAAAADDIRALTRAPLRQQPGSFRAYYSRGADGLATATSRARATDVLRLLGLVNVADGNAAALPQVTQKRAAGVVARCSVRAQRRVH